MSFHSDNQGHLHKTDVGRKSRPIATRPMTRGLKKPGRTLNIAVPRTVRRSRELNTTLGEPPHHVGVLLPFQLTRAGYVSPRCALVALIELGARG